MDVQSLAYKEIPDNKLQARVLTNVSRADWGLTIVTVLMMGVTFAWIYQWTSSTIPPLIAVMFESFIYAVLMFRMREGFYRIYGELFYGLTYGIKHMLFGAVWWKANDTDRWLVRWLRNRNGKRPALPYNFTVIKAELDGKVERIAILRELDRPYDHVKFICDGGSFVTHDPSMQMRLVDVLASIVNRAVSMADLKLGISYSRVLSPYDETQIRDFFGSNMNPIIASPELFELDEDTLAWVNDMRETFGELRPAAHALGAADSQAVVTLTIKRDRRTWRQARGGKLTDQELYDLPIVELSRAMADALASNSLFDFQHVKVLGLADLAKLTRISLDVADIQEYYLARKSGKIPVSDDEIDTLVEKGVSGLNARLQCWPRESIELGPDGKWMRIDGTYFSVLRITQMPKRARADQFLNLHYLAPRGVWTRISMVGQSISGSTETRNLIIQSSALANFQQTFFANRIVDDPRRRRRSREIESQTEEISANTIAQSFNILVVVAATSAREAVRHRRTMKGNLLDAGFDAQFIDDIPYLQNAIHTGVLGINRL